MAEKHRIYTMAFSRVYSALVNKVVRKGRTQAEVDKVIYFWRTAESQILLVAVFAKNVQVDLAPAQLKALARAYAG